MDSPAQLSDLLEPCSGGVTMPAIDELPTIWDVPDELWMIFAALLAELDPPSRSGRRRTDERAALNGIIYRARTGCQWNHLPREYGDDSSVHRAFTRWREKGVLKRFWGLLVAACGELGGVDWEWQSADCRLGKARFGGAQPGATRPTAANAAPSRAC